MAARQPGETQMATDSAIVESSGVDPAAAFSRRVVSVSARDAGTEAGEGGLSSEVFVTPRVIDEQAFNELAGVLRSLIDEATEAGQALKDQLDAASGGDANASEASTQLQERLRLGARMIKALQSQIAQIEGLLERADAHPVHTAEFESNESLEERVRAFEARLDEAVSDRERRIDELIGTATKKIDDVLGEPMVRLSELETRLLEIEQRIDTAADDGMKKLEKYVADRRDDLSDLDQSLIDTAQRVGELSATMERAEVNIAMLEHKRDQALDAINGMTDLARQTAREATDIIRQCDDARAQLSEDLLEAGEKIDGLGREARQFGSQLESRIRKSGTLQDELAERVETLSKTIERANQASCVAGELDALLEKLKPWRPILLGEPSDESGSAGETPDTPQPLLRLLEHVQRAIGANMTQLAGAMREVASCADELFAARAGESDSTTPGAEERTEPDPPLRLSAEG